MTRARIHRVRFQSARLQQLAVFAFVVFFVNDSLPATSSAQAPPGPQAAAPEVSVRPSSGLETLERARQAVTAFFEQSSNIVCAESITQSLVAKNGKSSYREESRYDYQLQATSASGSLKISESRDARKLPFRDPSRTLLVTNGFASLLLVVHPNYESSYEFESLGEDTVDGLTLAKIGYKPVPGASSPAAMQLRGKNYPLPLSGTIWINEANGAITRMTASVGNALSDLGLKSMESDIHYAQVQFHDPEDSYWMPVSAAIDLETPMQHWHNLHRFTAYRRFRATIQVEMGKPQ